MANENEEGQERRSRSRHRKHQRRKRRHTSSDSDSSVSSTRSSSKSHKRRKHRRHHRHGREHKSRKRVQGSSRRRSTLRTTGRVYRGNPVSIGEKEQFIDSMGTPTPVISLTTAPVEAPTAPEPRADSNQVLPQPAQQQLSQDTISNDNNSATNNITVNDISKLLQTLVQPNAIKYDRNIIPTFDPLQQNQRIENWIAKVNECAQIYNWTDTQTTHFALPKLSGHAKKWYEGLQTILLTWAEWQDRLTKAFPSETNYGVVLSEMLERRLKPGESIDEYYYDKITLLNVCEIVGKKAVDCLIHGIDDRIIRASASSARYKEPEELLKFLKDLCKENYKRLLV